MAQSSYKRTPCESRNHTHTIHWAQGVKGLSLETLKDTMSVWPATAGVRNRSTAVEEVKLAAPDRTNESTEQWITDPELVVSCTVTSSGTSAGRFLMPRLTTVPPVTKPLEGDTLMTTGSGIFSGDTQMAEAGVTHAVAAPTCGEAMTVKKSTTKFMPQKVS
jgi:hypothetical protein